MREANLAALESGATSFNEIDLSGASYVVKVLDGAVFLNATLKNVNFVGASLRGATI